VVQKKLIGMMFTIWQRGSFIVEKQKVSMRKHFGVGKCGEPLGLERLV